MEQGAKPIRQASASPPGPSVAGRLAVAAAGAPLSLEGDACAHGVQVRY